MSILDELNRLSSAEEFFTVLGIPFEEEVVRVSRLHILRRMGQYIKGSHVDGSFDGKSDDEIRAMCKEHLESAYEDFLKSSPIQERVFKVHKEAVAPKPAAAKPVFTLGTLGTTNKPS